MMRYEVHTERGPVPVDMIEQTVGGRPGYKLTVPGYAAVALFERSGDYWEYEVSTPGRLSRKSGRLDSRLTANVVQIYGGRALVHYIEDNAIPLRTGQVPKTKPSAPVDRDAKYRTGRAPSYRRTRHGGMRKNHNGILGNILDFIVDVLWD